MTAPDRSPLTHHTRIAFIGGGNMARSLIGGLIRAGTFRTALTVGEPGAELTSALAHDFGVAAGPDNAVAVDGAAAWVLAVKPQVMKAVCEPLRDLARANKPLVISVAAGIRTEQIERWLGGNAAIVRCMPNTPALIGAGAIGLYCNGRVSAEQHALAERILSTAGATAWIDDEALMDTVTALSGSGPAYFFLLVEALENAAVAQGLPRETARALAAQTCLGAGRMLCEDGATPAELRRRVTSAGGTTQAALDSFAASGFSTIVAHAVAAATVRGRELSEHVADDEK
ncbi:MAG TPA: pyrroline-5-carboxylate reductase [Rhodanobacteraceae bacterium]|jgi:pyrroline-5-carboxylate reductase|nr:pyrroline-5-carboxylate reductase [Rhodanobacteraceae bacterium]